MKIFISICFLLFNFRAFASNSDTFIIKIFPQKIQVSSPPVFKKNLSVIIENKSMVKVLAKISDEDEAFEKMLTIKTNKFKTLDLALVKGKRYFLTPMSPPYQSVELKVGQKDYEIPAKK